MAITDKLNTSWATNETMDAVFEVRAAAQNVYNVLSEQIARINAITADATFASVDAEIKTEGAAVITILESAKTALDGHTDFLNWSQP